MKEQKKRHHILRSGNEGKKIKHFNGHGSSVILLPSLW